MDIDKKIKSIEENCMVLAEIDAENIRKNIEQEKEEKINQFMEEYKAEVDLRLIKEKAKVQKDYNHDLFLIQKEGQIKLQRFKEKLIKDLENKVLENIYNYKNTEEYKNNLINIINNTLNKIGNDYSKTRIILVEEDYNRFFEEFKNRFNNIEIGKVSNDYIGGCIIFDGIKDLILDNTIKTNLDEKLKKVDF